MENFIYDNPTKIIFGKGKENEIGSEVLKLNKNKKNVLIIHYGTVDTNETELFKKVEKSLQAEGIQSIEFTGVKPNPRLSLVRKGIQISREKKIGFIIAIGGGSVIDTAKAIGLGVPFDGDIWDIYTGKAATQECLPIGVVLTIASSGSESSNSSVITNEDGWLKRSYNSDCERPVFAIMNPELTFTLPLFQTICGICDMMTHVMERYFTNTLSVDLTDRLSEGTLQTIIKNAPIVVKDPTNYDARAEIMWAGSNAHNGLLGTGRETDFASHLIEQELSGMYDIAHGAGMAVIFPAWMKYVHKHNINRFVQYASRVWNLNIDFENYEKTALEGIDKTEQFFRYLGLHTTLKELGIGNDRFEELANKCRLHDIQNETIGRFVKLKRDDIVSILRLAQ